MQQKSQGNMAGRGNEEDAPITKPVAIKNVVGKSEVVTDGTKEIVMNKVDEISKPKKGESFKDFLKRGGVPFKKKQEVLETKESEEGVMKVSKDEVAEAEVKKAFRDGGNEETEEARVQHVMAMCESVNHKVKAASRLALNQGKRNQGVYLVEFVTGHKGVVKIELPGAQSDGNLKEVANKARILNELLAKDGKGVVLNLATLMPGGSGKYFGVVFGVYVAAEGQSLQTIHEGVVDNRMHPREGVTAYRLAGEAMGKLHFRGAQSRAEDEELNGKSGLSLRAHGDANPSNIFVNGDGKTGAVTLIDLDKLSLAVDWTWVEFDMGSMWMMFTASEFKKLGSWSVDGQGKSKVAKDAVSQVQWLFEMYDAMSVAHVSQVPEDEAKLKERVQKAWYCKRKELEAAWEKGKEEGQEAKEE